jgi:hypothetical protein
MDTAYVFGSPGSGSESFYQQAKNEEKPGVDVPSNKNKYENLEQKNYFLAS